MLCLKEIIQISHFLKHLHYLKGLENQQNDRKWIHLQLTKLCPSLWAERPKPSVSKWRIAVQPIIMATKTCEVFKIQLQSISR